MQDALGLRGLRAPKNGADLVAKTRDGRDVLIERKRLSTVRHDDLAGRLAVGVLSLRRHALEQDAIVPLVVVELPHLSEEAAAVARKFMATHAGDVDWALAADDGDFVIHAPRVGGECSKITPRGHKRRSLTPSRRRPSLFTDLNEWMLKVLLLGDAPKEMWGGPRGPTRTVRELAEKANVSVPHAHRFVRTFEERDHLRVTDEGIALVRKPALMDAWLQAVRQASREAVPVRWLLGEPGSLDEIFAGSDEGIFAKRIFDETVFASTDSAEAKRPVVALGGFDACRAHGVLHTKSTGAEVHVRASLQEACAAFDLEPCDDKDAHLTLLPTRRGEAIFRGVVMHQGGAIPVVDILQAALDVAPHPARGIEQAEHIIHDVLGLGP